MAFLSQFFHQGRYGYQSKSDIRIFQRFIACANFGVSCISSENSTSAGFSAEFHMERIHLGRGSSVGTVILIIAAAISMRLNIISETLNAAILLVAILTVTLASLLLSAIFEPNQGHVKQPIVIVGAGELGLQVASQLNLRTIT